MNPLIIPKPYFPNFGIHNLNLYIFWTTTSFKHLKLNTLLNQHAIFGKYI